MKIKISKEVFCLAVVAILLHTFTADAAVTFSSPTAGDQTFTLAESTAVGYEVITILAASTGQTISSYSMTTSSVPFTFDGTTRILKISSALDYETTTSYTLNFEATDSANAVGTATVTVSVSDVDEAPVFSPTSYTACPSDGSAGGTAVTTVTASDNDVQDILAYSVYDGDDNSQFDFTNNILIVKNGETLDKSTTPSYTLVVRVTDNESPAQIGSATVTVNVGGDCSSAAAIALSAVTILTAILVSLQ